MPYSNNPNYSTYKTEKIQLIKDVFLRSTSTYDALYQNCIIEILVDKATKQADLAIVKRPGTDTVLDSSSITSEFRGVFFWERQNTLIYVIGNTIYKWDVSTNISTASALTPTLTTTTGEVGFEEYLYDNGGVSVVWSDGTQLGEITSTYSINVSTSSNLPSPHFPNPIFLDGYIFIVKSSSQDIYNSDLNAPLNWTSGNYISAEMSPDALLRIERMSNYLVALGANSIEYFYDAGNASGSPLGRNSTFYKQIKYLGGSYRSGNKVYIIGKYDNGAPDLFIIEDSKVTPVENHQLSRYLSRVTNFSGVTASIMSWNSNTIYLFTVGGSTFAYHIEADFVTNWSYSGLNQFNIKYSDVAYSSVGVNTYMYNPDVNRMIKFDFSTYFDSSNPVTMTIRTEPLDFGSLQRKFMGRLSLLCDNGDTIATMNLSWTDDDYQTYSNVYPIPLNQELPSIRRLGGFRKRALLLTNSEDQPVRIRSAEVEINIGNA